MTTALAPNPSSGEIERVLLEGDLSRLTESQRLVYYNQMCASLGLNPLTKPFSYIKLNGKLVLYALKDATEQLRKLHGVSITSVSAVRLEDVYVVTAIAADRTGRTDAATGAVAIANLKGEALANAIMKGETKAKRRVTLSICGLGMLDETEAESITAQAEVVNAPRVRLALAPGTFQILDVKAQSWGGEVIAVDAQGEEHLFKTSDNKVRDFCRVNALDCVPVTFEFTEITRGENKGKLKLSAVHRAPLLEQKAIEAAPIAKMDEYIKAENKKLDAAIAAAEDVL